MNLCAWLFVAAALLAPPSGRPPIGPLERLEPKLYDVSFGVTVSTAQQIIATDRERYDLRNTPIVMPVIFQGAYSRVEHDSLQGRLWLTGRELAPKLELKPDYPHHTHLATMTIDSFRGLSLRWEIKHRAQVWASRINDEQAASIAWPKEWPEEVQDGLKPQTYIESDDPVFAAAVQRVSEGKLRSVPPYLAAKDLVRYCINEIPTRGDGMHQGEFGVILGMAVFGAKEAARVQQGTPHDLVCVCVAMLRAAGIPARPVIGAQEDENDRAELVSWAEFYLPEAGWVPFDPYVMRGKGIRSLDVRKAWPEFGTMDDLNRRIPLGYHFIPEATVQSPRNPAVWGWDPQPNGTSSSEQHITITITSRGAGQEDPK